jgi:hypothetical protein
MNSEGRNPHSEDTSWIVRGNPAAKLFLANNQSLDGDKAALRGQPASEARPQREGDRT